MKKQLLLLISSLCLLCASGCANGQTNGNEVFAPDVKITAPAERDDERTDPNEQPSETPDDETPAPLPDFDIPPFPPHRHPHPAPPPRHLK